MTNESEHRLHFMRAVELARYPVDPNTGGDARCASCLRVEETPTSYLITTRVHGIEPASLHVSIVNNYLIIEGKLLTGLDGQRGIGRYARLLEVAHPINPDYTEVVYHADGLLQLCVWKQPLPEPA
jgi:hypothetical protein